MDSETERYLEEIRKTIAASRHMVESVKLRFAETDRLLEQSGTSREEVMKMRFTPEQEESVNEELKRRGFYPLDSRIVEPAASVPTFMPDVADVSSDMENRRRKFGAMMKTFRM